MLEVVTISNDQESDLQSIASLSAAHVVFTPTKRPPLPGTIDKEIVKITASTSHINYNGFLPSVSRPPPPHTVNVARCEPSPEHSFYSDPL